MLNEVVTAVEVPGLAANQRTGYAKVAHPASGYAVVGGAMVCALLVLLCHCRSVARLVVLEQRSSSRTVPGECQGVVRNIVCRPLLATGVYLRHYPQTLGKAMMEILEENGSELEGKRIGVIGQGR